MEQQGIKELLMSGQIDSAKSKFKNRRKEVQQALKEWDIAEHEIMKRTDKVLKDGDTAKSWNLPISYQKKIVRSSVAFLFGKPLLIKQESKNTDTAFNALTELLKDMRMASKDQENARLMFSETESAKLFVEYRDINITDEEVLKTPGLVRVKCILLAKSLGDTLHVSFDAFGVMQAFGREYSVKVGNENVEHFDVYTADTIFLCKKEKGVWQTEPKINRIGKIPVVYYLHPEKQTEWADVQKLIERREWLTSIRADNNDRTGDPILVLNGEVESLPEANTVGKVVKLGLEGRADYLVPQMSVDLISNEKEDLKELIHYLTDTPDLSQEKMTSLGLTSGKAIEMAFFGCMLKALERHGFFEEMKDREISVVLAFMEKIIYVSMAAEIKRVKTSIEFGNPLPDNTSDIVDMISSATGGKPIMSQRRGVELNPMVKDVDEEMKRLKEEDSKEKEDEVL